MNERVKLIRKQLGMTQEQLAQRLGIGKAALSMIETGKAGLSARNRNILVQELNVNPDWLETGKGNMFNPFIGLLKAGYGTLAYRDEWNLFDNIIVSENLATGSTGSLKIQPAGNSKFYGGIFRRPYMIQKEGQYKGYPLRTFVGNDFQGGFSDHFPVYIYIAK